MKVKVIGRNWTETALQSMSHITLKNWLWKRESSCLYVTRYFQYILKEILVVCLTLVLCCVHVILLRPIDCIKYGRSLRDIIRRSLRSCCEDQWVAFGIVSRREPQMIIFFP